MTSESPASLNEARAAFDGMVSALRPRLHRYCARMTGSVIDGEDVVQIALVKAFHALPSTAGIKNLEAWMFRIAHNAALDFVRKRARERDIFAEDDAEALASEEVADREIAAMALSRFMHLPPRQRSCVILKDVLGHSIEEIGGFIEASGESVKAALARGRTRLRELADEPEPAPPPAMDETERARLDGYIKRFNARDFDALRGMLSEDVQLGLVARHRANGRTEVGNYFGNYERVTDWLFRPGWVEWHPAILVHNPADSDGTPVYFILLDWSGSGLSSIRDFRYARYVMQDASYAELESN